MEIVKAGRSRQVTIPKKVFDSLGLKEGDYIGVAVENGKIVMTPVVVMSKEKAKEEFFRLSDKVRSKTSQIDQSHLEEEVQKAIDESRIDRNER